MLRRLTSALLALACLPLLQACGTATGVRTVTEERVTRLEIPAELTDSCADHPGMPDARTATQRDVALLIVGQYEAWRDCRVRFDALRALVLELEGRD